MRNEHIETIRRQSGIALATIYNYNNEHKGDIERIGNIFYLNGKDSKEKVLALLDMLSLGEEDDAVKKYRAETGLKDAEYDSANLLNKYAELLLTAMIYNPAFYAMAVNFRGFVNAGYAIGEVEEDSLDLGLVEEEEEFAEAAIIFVFKINGVIPLPALGAAAGHELKRFGEIYHFDDINVDEGLYCGDLTFWGDEKDQVLQLMFKIKDEKTGKPVDDIPFYLNVEFTLHFDMKRHTIKLDRVMKTKRGTICSGLIPINWWPKGISDCKITGVRILGKPHE